jgi:PAS domain S-box-containing protein
MPANVLPTGKEVFFPEDDIIVSKTDLKGRITYANRLFCRIAEYSEGELLNQPHSIIRHPDMPRSVFKLLWDSIADGREVFAYVKNMSRSGHHYWVFAHVTPSYDNDKKIVGYHSNRRAPNREVVSRTIEPLYAALLQEENRHKNGQQSLAAGYQTLTKVLAEKSISYDELIFSL